MPTQVLLTSLAPSCAEEDVICAPYNQVRKTHGGEAAEEQNRAHMDRTLLPHTAAMAPGAGRQIPRVPGHTAAGVQTESGYMEVCGGSAGDSG